MESKRVRVFYRKGKEIAFLSHLDLVRAFSRLVRRAEIPIQFSGGFHPRPLISMGPALPVGATGEEELLDLFLSETPHFDLLFKMRAFSPPGLDILKLWPVEENSPSLTSFSFLSHWCLEGRWESLPPSDFGEIILSRESLPILRRTPKVSKGIDLKPFLKRLNVGKEFLDFELLSSPSGGARLEEVIGFLEKEGFPFHPRSICRKKLILIS